MSRYVGNSPVNYTDPSGLQVGGAIPGNPWNPKPRSWNHSPRTSPDEKRLIELAGDDEASQIAVQKLLEILKESPSYPYRPFVQGDRCLKWAREVTDKIYVSQFKDELTNALVATQFTPKYVGPIPTFTVHSLVKILLPNGESVYLDDFLYGGCDHIFFETSGDLLFEGTPEYTKYFNERAEWFKRAIETHDRGNWGSWSCRLERLLTYRVD